MIERFEGRRCIVYRGNGEPFVTELTAPQPHPVIHTRTIADRVPVRDAMSRDLICARAELDVAPVLDVMVRHRIGCVPVVDEQRTPVGVITKYDVLEHLRRARRIGDPLTAGQIMMPYVTTVQESETLAHAAALMMCEDIHHVLVVAGDTLTGVLSSNDIVAWLVANDAATPEGHRTESPWREWDS